MRLCGCIRLEVGGPIAQSRMDTLEHSTQTLGCGSHWSYSWTSSAQSDLASWPACTTCLSAPLTTPAQHLRAVGESPSQVWPKRSECQEGHPHEVPQTQMMDGSTQTTVDEGIQTDPSPPPLHLQAPEADLRRSM